MTKVVYAVSRRSGLYHNAGKLVVTGAAVSSRSATFPKPPRRFRFAGKVVHDTPPSIRAHSTLVPPFYSLPNLLSPTRLLSPRLPSKTATKLGMTTDLSTQTLRSLLCNHCGSLRHATVSSATHVAKLEWSRESDDQRS